MAKRQTLVETRLQYIEKLLSKTVQKGQVGKKEQIICSECGRILNYLEEYLIFNKKIVCQDICMKYNKVQYKGYTDDYLNDVFVKFYKLFPEKKMKKYDIVACQIVPISYNNKIKYHIDVLYRHKLDKDDNKELTEKVYEIFKKCPIDDCNREINKLKLEIMFSSENPEKIKQKNYLVELLNIHNKGRKKLGKRFSVGLPCCKHSKKIFGNSSRLKNFKKLGFLYH